MSSSKMRFWRGSAFLILGLAAVWWAALPADEDSSPRDIYRVERPASARGTVVVPDDFLRRWDPVTAFFTKDTGFPSGGPEDYPEQFIKLEPAHPGAWTWLDARTLQFRPADPWPPLRQYTFTVDRKSFVLSTLMAAPISTLPENNSEGLRKVDAVTLTFADPIDPEALATMVRIELRPLPGVDADDARYLTGDDFRIKALERSAPSAPATYVLSLKEPLPMATRAIVHFRLSLKENNDTSAAQITFATATPFHASALGCGGERLPLSQEGSRFTRSQALLCDPGQRSFYVQFSAELRPMDPLEARSLVRIEPPVDNLELSVQGQTLAVSGDFQPETLYKVGLSPAPIADIDGRKLELKGPNEGFLSFPRVSPFLRLFASQGVVERFGPQMVPLQGYGHDRADLRIYAIPPLERSLWPFPAQPVTVNESQRPPGPGEEPAPFSDPRGRVSSGQVAQYISTMGSPPVSTLVDLHPLGSRETNLFGLDLATYLERISGKNAPGTYLVGVRRLDDSSYRDWMRIQVTDLSLTSFEEPERVVFTVTSLATGKAVSSASVTLEGSAPQSSGKLEWKVLAEGKTDRLGLFTWTAPGPDPGYNTAIQRIVVRKGDDVLVIDPSAAPDRYADNHWDRSYETWLQWAFQSLHYRGPKPETLCHIFTERPVYRPEEPVHIKGYIRERNAGELKAVQPEAFVRVEGPGDLSWDYPVDISEMGSFYQLFEEAGLPTGAYSARLMVETGAENPISCGFVSFNKEAYRLPRFEVLLHSPDKAPLDKPFNVSLTGAYYAGGKVAGRPLRWRVTQYPYTWTPKKREGFLYSSDGRFSRTSRFESTPELTKEDVTDPEGAASLRIDPSIEPSAQPRSYVIEATVTGDDDQTVTSTRRVLALPAFVLGIRTPRYVARADHITPEVILAGYDDELIPDRQVRVRLLNRQWHSHLRAGDFSDGVARYITEVVDEKVSETLIVTGKAPVPVNLAIPRAGVYVVELEARDALGRAQVVAVDLYVGGSDAVSWSKAEARVFKVTPDKDKYNPGETATLVVQSPFQNAEALVVLEAPEGNSYRWSQVKGGSAALRIPIEGTYTPNIPVHVVLMRGRTEGTLPSPGALADLGKPATVASTTWLNVDPVDNRVDVGLEHPEKALPGQQIPVTIRLRDPAGRPLSGEVTLWLVDQAVLALGSEQRLDPLPDFITAVRSYLQVHDTRDFPFGILPSSVWPGGGEGEEEAGNLLDRATIRKNFQPVPYYKPDIQVGPDGVVKVMVDLPDNLTNFKVRAKAISGPDRFGFAKGTIAVRLPVIVQPSLPRFVRPGDQFEAMAIGRIVEGEGGAGTAAIRVEGVELEGSSTQSVALDPKQSARIVFPVKIPTPGYTKEGLLSRDQVLFRIGVERSADKASDAFEVTLPLVEDRPRITDRVVQALEPGKTLALPDVPATARAGSVRRAVLVSNHPKLVEMASGLDFLREYPYGCTEQRLSRARAYLATRGLRDVLHLEATSDEIDRAVNQTLDWVSRVVDDGGLVAYWPGSPGYVSLTAWTLEFLVEARAARYTVDEDLFQTLIRSLRQSLRSDYSRFIDGAAYAERSMALNALAIAGRFDAGYGAELARKAQYLDQEGKARVAMAFALGGRADEEVAVELADSLWSGLVIRLYQGKEAYGGLQSQGYLANGLILPGETRTLAATTRAILRYQAANPRAPLLVDALLTLGEGDGWGSTNANSEALLALSEIFQPPFESKGRQVLTLKVGGESERLELGGETPTAYRMTTEAGPGEVARQGSEAGEGPVVVRISSTYIPGEDGSQIASSSQGFVVSRTLLVIQPGEAPAKKLALEQPGRTVTFSVGDVVEEHVQVVNPEDRFYVAITIPLAAGMEPLNPTLATAPPEARPSGQLTLEPTYVAFLDDRMAYYYNALPKGTYDFYFRTRANVPGRFIQPAAMAEMMYDAAVRGNSVGAMVEVK